MDELSKTLCSSNYAKDNGVLLYNNDVYIREDTPALALLEVRRVLGRAFVPITLAPEAFDEMLAKIWQQSSGVSQQLVDDMDADIDLMALTEEIPDNEDLLDNDENSPVIRLINAILGEAVKDGASDIHIETFERTLSIRFRVDGVLRPVLQPARKLAPLLVSRIKVMSKLDIAEKRLSAIREFTQFGAGFKIAMRDLEIRGAGNLLGPEQHGHMAAVGYDLYCKIVEGAVKEAKGEKEPVKIDTVVDIPVPASISTHYIPRESERLSMYKRIALIETRDDLYDVQDELIDRYGDIPEDTANLLNIALIKADCSRAGVTQLRIRDKEVRFVFDKQAPIDGAKLIAAAGNIAGARMTFGDTPSMVISRPKSDAAALYAMLPQFVYMLADCLSAN